ncbi:zinc finger MYM-type protein 5-like [Macrobrachium nipponense]|uniref:zinc finger MYM-type protein 5-like n=1 Tax=Macrobrachium nipponense TaxID=159736 RepID=UPI0030C84719
MYSHKSGALKRKEIQAREEAVSKCARTLFEVGVKKIDTNIEEQNILPSSSESDPSTSQSLVQDAQQEAESDVINAEPKDTEQQRDIGLIPDRPSRVQIEDFVRQGPQPIPSQIASDGETGKRDWLVYSQRKRALFCFPCRLFIAGCTQQPKTPSNLASCGIGKQSSWKKLYNRIPEHEHTNYHKQCYLDRRQLEARLKEESGIDDQLQRSIQSEKSKWKLILKRILDVVRTLGERGLSFQGESSMICDTNNGNFLGIIELLSRYDAILQDHVSEVREAQKDGKRLQAHYLSYSSQNEFIQ